jgi:hypothetical protein
VVGTAPLEGKSCPLLAGEAAGGEGAGFQGDGPGTIRRVLAWGNDLGERHVATDDVEVPPVRAGVSGRGTPGSGNAGRLEAGDLRPGRRPVALAVHGVPW